MKIVVGVAVLLIVGLIAVNSAPRQSTEPSDRATTIIVEDFRFAPNRIDAKVGVSITLVLANRGSERHDLNFQSLHMPGLLGVEAILEPGESRTVTLTFDQPGTHTFICTLPGHVAAGMTGAAYVAP